MDFLAEIFAAVDGIDICKICIVFVFYIIQKLLPSLMFIVFIKMGLSIDQAKEVSVTLCLNKIDDKSK